MSTDPTWKVEERTVLDTGRGRAIPASPEVMQFLFPRSFSNPTRFVPNAETSGPMTMQVDGQAPAAIAQADPTWIGTHFPKAYRAIMEKRAQLKAEGDLGLVPPKGMPVASAADAPRPSPAVGMDERDNRSSEDRVEAVIADLRGGKIAPTLLAALDEAVQRAKRDRDARRAIKASG